MKDQSNRSLEIEDNVNITLIIRTSQYKYLLETKWRQYVEGSSFLSFAGKFVGKYGKKLKDIETKTGIDAAKNTSKRVVQKAAEVTGHLIGSKIDDQITSAVKPKNEKQKDKTNEVDEIYIPSDKRQRIIDDLWLP